MNTSLTKMLVLVNSHKIWATAEMLTNNLANNLSGKKGRVPVLPHDQVLSPKFYSSPIIRGEVEMLSSGSCMPLLSTLSSSSAISWRLNLSEWGPGNICNDRWSIGRKPRSSTVQTSFVMDDDEEYSNSQFLSKGMCPVCPKFTCVGYAVTVICFISLEHETRQMHVFGNLHGVAFPPLENEVFSRPTVCNIG